ncbi:MAG: hypothetical protein ACYS8W_11575 [Planctomycetota bacterium]
MSDSSGNPKREIRSLLNRKELDYADAVTSLVDRGSPETLLEAAEEELKKAKTPGKKALLHVLASRIHFVMNRYPEAEQEALRAAQLEKIDTNLRAYAWQLISGSYLYQKDFTSAETFSKKALGYISENKDSAFALILNTMGGIHAIQRKYELPAKRSGINICSQIPAPISR